MENKQLITQEGTKRHASSARIAEASHTGLPSHGSLIANIRSLIHRHKYLTFWIPIAAAIITLAFTLLRPREYRSDAAFIPARTRSVSSSFAGVAAQLGIDVPAENFDQSPQFYVDLIKSREILNAVVQKPYPPGTSTLIDIYGVEGDSPGERLYRAVTILRESLRVQHHSETGIVRFSVAQSRRDRAQAVAAAILTEINTFNANRRRGVAQLERQFIESQLEKANRELLAAEQRLSEFDQRNAQIDRSPDLRLQRDRIMRQVSDRHQLVAMLNQSFVRASIDEVKNTPAVSVIESPSVPIDPEPRGAVLMTLTVLIMATFVGVVAAIAIDFVRNSEAFGLESGNPLRTRGEDT